MAEERTLGIARAEEESGRDPSKAELQRRMEEARESISSTVGEIKDSVAQQVETVKDALDWREHFKRQPVAWSLGALGVGFLTGYCIAATIKGDGQDDYLTLPAYSPDQVRESLYPESANLAAGIAPTSSRSRTNGQDEDEGPGLFERFKETSAYDRLSKEVGTLGDRLVDELSHTAQTVVLPALLLKVKNWIGLDLSEKKPQQVSGSTSNREPRNTQNRSTQNQSTYEPVLDV
jgi:hypothetical protein